MGGTELLKTLTEVCASRELYIPTAIFVLTDGEVGHLRNINSVGYLTSSR